MRSSPSQPKSARLLVQPSSAPRAAASPSPSVRSSRLAKPRPTPTMRGAAARSTASPCLGRRATRRTARGHVQGHGLDLRRRRPPRPRRRSLGHDGEHLHGRGERLALHGGAAEGVAAATSTPSSTASERSRRSHSRRPASAPGAAPSPGRGAWSPAARRSRRPAARCCARPAATASAGQPANGLVLADVDRARRRRRRARSPRPRPPGAQHRRAQRRARARRPRRRPPATSSRAVSAVRIDEHRGHRLTSPGRLRRPGRPRTPRPARPAAAEQTCLRAAPRPGC